MNPDAINAGFELMGVLASLLNVVALLRHREVRGCAPEAVAFFTVWGVWNIWYYTHLDQTYSAVAAGGLVIVNGAWLLLAWRYSR